MKKDRLLRYLYKELRSNQDLNRFVKYTVVEKVNDYNSKFIKKLIDEIEKGKFN